MSLRDTTSVDVIGRRPDGGYDLFVYDAGDIADEHERYRLLIEKLRSYVEYVATGQHREQAPEASVESFTIRVICQSPPNEEMRQVTGVRLSGDSVTRLPVVFVLESAFRAELLQRRRSQTAEKAKPWWRFW